MNWTGEQNQIFNHVETSGTHLQANALPGCTKTSTTIESINRGKRKSNYVVFGKRNQLEAEQKISNPNVRVQTIHGFSLGFLSQAWRGVRGNFATEWNRIKAIYPESPDQVKVHLMQLVGKLKNSFIFPTDKDAMDICTKWGIDGGKYAEEFPINKLAEMAMQLIRFSAVYPKDRNISFDDMIFLPAHLGLVKPISKFLAIDEAQDVNSPQFHILTNSLLPDGQAMVVGDDNQAIFGWRGAMPGSMSKFQKELNAIAYKLTVNFRCDKAIIKFAQALMPELQAGPNAGEGKVETVNQDKAFGQIKVKDAILSRRNCDLMPICLKLLAKNIPTYIEGKDIGRDLIQLVESFEASNVNEFFDRLQKWQDAVAARSTGWLAAHAIALANDKATTLRTLAETCLTVPDITQKIKKLFLDEDDVRVPSVICSTVHKFKGREADSVFLVNESFNTRRGLTAEEQVEETNIYKVAITRPRHYLGLMSSK